MVYTKVPKKEYNYPVDLQSWKLVFTVYLLDNFFTRSVCKSCWRTIYWAKTTNNKMMPISRQYIPNLWEYDIFSHYDDCPYADKFRK